MWLIAGLGNPGLAYALNRHNIGFMVVDALTDLENFLSKYTSLYLKTTLSDQPVILCKPQTYMNVSGKSVSAWVNFYKIPLDHVIVVHDDIDLKFGTVKVKQGGGNGGHNGLASIDASIGKDYHRIRLGVGRPSSKDEVSHYVLSNFAKTELDGVADMIQQACTLIHEMVR